MAWRLEQGPSFLELFRGIPAGPERKTGCAWNRALAIRRFFLIRRNVVAIPLSRPEYQAIRNEDTSAALEKLVQAVEQSLAARQRRAQDFAATLARWRTWCAGRSRLEAITELETAAVRHREQIEAASADWYQGWAIAVGRWRACLMQTQAVLRLYEPLFSADPAAEEVSVRLSRAQREAIDLPAAEAAAAWLRQNRPSPSETAEATFGLWELGVWAHTDQATQRPEMPRNPGQAAIPRPATRR